MAYNSAVDICNRALQHCGVPPSNRIAALTDNTKNAKECALVYDKVRESELREKVWRFSIRHTFLRAIDTDTKIYLPPTYAAATTYAVGDIVAYTDPVDDSPRYWISDQASNTGNTPTDGEPWENYFGPVTVSSYDSTIGYDTGELVYDDSNNVWFSLVSGNSAALSEGTSWHELTGTLQAFHPIYPLGSGPYSDSTSRNVYRLPYGFLRAAPQDPKAGSTSYLGAPSGLAYNDWLFEGDYLVSTQSDPVVLRFAADWTDVTTMDALFCEGLAARVAQEICESVTQGPSKLAAVTAAYNRIMSKARVIDAIEVGSEELPIDDWIACRA